MGDYDPFGFGLIVDLFWVAVAGIAVIVAIGIFVWRKK